MAINRRRVFSNKNVETMDEVIIAQLLICIVKAMANANKIGGKGVVNEQWSFMDCQR